MGCIMNLQPIRRREVSELLENLKKQYDNNHISTLIDEYSFFISPKNKVYIVTNMIREIPFENLRINNTGLYFCELNPGGVRLSIEGSQMIGKHATKNILVVDDETAVKWLRGEDLVHAESSEGFILVKNNSDFLGCTKFRDGKLLNFTPKARRIQSVNP